MVLTLGTLGSFLVGSKVEIGAEQSVFQIVKAVEFLKFSNQETGRFKAIYSFLGVDP